jgi:hypothetical protein
MSANKEGLTFLVKGRLYEIKREGNAYYLVDEDGNKYKIKNYNIDCDSVLIVADTRPNVDWDFCEGGEI